jgi:hypothetical protein
LTVSGNTGFGLPTLGRSTAVIQRGTAKAQRQHEKDRRTPLPGYRRSTSAGV